jgi:hypothetical protein
MCILCVLCLFCLSCIVCVGMHLHTRARTVSLSFSLHKLITITYTQTPPRTLVFTIHAPTPTLKCTTPCDSPVHIGECRDSRISLFLESFVCNTSCMYWFAFCMWFDRYRVCALSVVCVLCLLCLWYVLFIVFILCSTCNKCIMCVMCSWAKWELIRTIHIKTKNAVHIVHITHILSFLRRLTHESELKPTPYLVFPKNGLSKNLFLVVRILGGYCIKCIMCTVCITCVLRVMCIIYVYFVFTVSTVRLVLCVGCWVCTACSVWTVNCCVYCLHFCLLSYLDVLWARHILCT